MTTAWRLKTISSMRFNTSSNVSPPPLGPSWRMILWAMTLAPSLLILSWSLRQARMPKSEFGSAEISAEETQRLRRILKEPREDVSSPLRDDSIRVVAASKQFTIDVGESSAPPSASDARLDKSILTSIKDNTFGVTAAEIPAYDAILAKVRNTSLAELEPLAQKDVPFALLMLDSDRFRGELLTIEGDIRRLNKLTDQSFEAWLFTVDSGMNPYRVICASLPDDVRLGEDLQPPIRARLSGYFFKRYSYATAHDFHTAPLVLAKTLTVLSRPKPPTSHSGGGSHSLTYLAVGILGTFLAVAVTVEMVFRRRSRRCDALPSKATDSPPDFTWLNRS